MTHFPKFLLNKGRIFALWVMYTTSFGQNPKEKQFFFRENVPKVLGETR